MFFLSVRFSFTLCVSAYRFFFLVFHSFLIWTVEPLALLSAHIFTNATHYILFRRLHLWMDFLFCAISFERLYQYHSTLRLSVIIYEYSQKCIHCVYSIRQALWIKNLKKKKMCSLHAALAKGFLFIIHTTPHAVDKGRFREKAIVKWQIPFGTTLIELNSKWIMPIIMIANIYNCVLHTWYVSIEMNGHEVDMSDIFEA